MLKELRGVGIGVVVVVLVLLIVIGICWKGFIGYNNDQDYQIRQAINGEIIVQDRGGFYPQLFNSVWTYPRVQDAFFSASEKEGGREDDSINVTFNDGGQAKISCFVRWKNPVKKEERIDLHRSFSGNPKNIEAAVRSALINVCKNTAPLMSASEHQSARKSEFAQLVEEQLRKGLYAMHRKEKTFSDKTDKDGKPVTIYVTEIVRDGKTNEPLVSQPSPLDKYNLEILQFSVTGTDYDKQTRDQFAAKKDAFLKAELAKSQKEEEVQKRLQVIEKGLREKAEMEAKMNVEKVQAVIQAEKEKEVAEQQKLKAEIEANKLLSVAEIQKKEAEVQLDKSKLEAAAKIELAKAKQKEIELSGAIKEETRILAEIQKDTKIGMSRAIADAVRGMNLPKTVIVTGGKDGNSNPMNSLMQLIMLKMAEADQHPKTVVVPVNR